MKNFITQAATQFGAIWGKIGVNQKISIVLVFILVVGGLWAFVSIARRPDYEVLYSDVSTEDGSRIKTHLSENGIPCRFTGSTILVPSRYRVDATTSLVNANLLPKKGHATWESLFEAKGIGVTDKEMQITMLRGIQGELARSLEGFSYIENATVHIVMPEDSYYRLYTEEQEPTTASVMVGLRPGAVLDGGQRNAIRYLVSNAVPGLKPGNISILDTDGNVIASGTGESSLDGLTDSQLSYKKAVERGLQRKAQEILDKALGVGKSVVQVTADINFDEKATIDTTRTTGALIEETVESTEGKDSTTREGGEPGMASNSSSVAVGGTGGGGSGNNSSEKTEMTTSKYSDPGQKVVQTVTKPGAIKRLTVAVLIDKGSDENSAVIASDFEEDIKNAVGFDENRGDKISVRETQFVAAAEEPVSSGGTTVGVLMGHVLKNVPLAVVIVVLLVFFRQLLKKTKLPEREVPDELRGVTGRAGLAVAGPGGASGEMSVEEAEELISLPETETPPMQKLMWKLADEKPETLAQMLRAWLRD